MITEIVVFSNYVINETHDNGVAILKEQDGCKRVFYGSQVEDPTTGYWVIEWDTIEKHKEFQASEGYKAFVEGGKDVGKVVKMLHVPLEPADDYTGAFTAPVTEISLTTLKPGVEAKDFEATVNIIYGAAKGTVDGSVSGKTVENEREYVLVYGWKSVQLHKDAISPPQAQEILAVLYKQADLDVKHATLKAA
ncbi:hypothetical protein BD410DRAFT_783226 [Rickenella mellea]|uniref:ABM domain-containing protein n=1 Tax=Rickenella mellea TaxID=50990 RepID=A0A4Y7QI76_9AGAM|nr:hypothetical protein BD410DRAFT_783226 [Rickenella mellea]